MCMCKGGRGVGKEKKALKIKGEYFCRLLNGKYFCLLVKKEKKREITRKNRNSALTAYKHEESCISTGAREEG